jgi:hypothetical protein
MLSHTKSYHKYVFFVLAYAGFVKPTWCETTSPGLNSVSAPRINSLTVGFGLSRTTSVDEPSSSRAASLLMQSGVTILHNIDVIFGMSALLVAQYPIDPSLSEDTIAAYIGARWRPADFVQMAARAGGTFLARIPYGNWFSGDLAAVGGTVGVGVQLFPVRKTRFRLGLEIGGRIARFSGGVGLRYSYDALLLVDIDLLTR